MDAHGDSSTSLNRNNTPGSSLGFPLTIFQALRRVVSFRDQLYEDFVSLVNERMHDKWDSSTRKGAGLEGEQTAGMPEGRRGYKQSEGKLMVTMGAETEAGRQREQDLGKHIWLIWALWQAGGCAKAGRGTPRVQKAGDEEGREAGWSRQRGKRR